MPSSGTARQMVIAYAGCRVGFLNLQPPAVRGPPGEPQNRGFGRLREAPRGASREGPKTLYIKDRFFAIFTL